MDERKLAQLADTAISNCVGETTKVSGSGEVPEVARLVLGLPDRLVKSWTGELLSGRVEVNGVFCHSTPQAHWTDPVDQTKTQRPELCDLLIVLDNYPPAGGLARRALLLQAKTGEDLKFEVLNGGPCIQRYMFANWPEIELVGLPLSNVTGINLAPAKAGECPGSRYALIDAVNRTWSLESKQADPIEPYSSMNDYAGKKSAPLKLGDALVSMLKGSLGTPCDGDWGTLVTHLLKLAQERIAEERQPAGVKSSVSGTWLPHASHASTFVNVTIKPPNFHFLARQAQKIWSEDIRSRSTLTHGQKIEPSEGFGVLHITTHIITWRDNG